MYFYKVSVVGQEVYVPVVISALVKYTEEEFTNLVRTAACTAMKEGWVPEDYEFPFEVVTILSRDHNFKVIEIEQEYKHPEFAMFHWTYTHLMDEDMLWVPEEVRKIVDNNIMNRDKKENNQ